MNDNRWEQAVEKLIRLTQNGKLYWSRNIFGNDRENVVGHTFTAHVQDRTIMLYEHNSQEYYCGSSYPGSSDEELEPEVAIEFVDSEGEAEYRWPVTAGRWDLLNAVRCQDVGAAEFLDSFLEDEESSEGSEDPDCPENNW